MRSSEGEKGNQEIIIFSRGGHRSIATHIRVLSECAMPLYRKEAPLGGVQDKDHRDTDAHPLIQPSMKDEFPRKDPQQLTPSGWGLPTRKQILTFLLAVTLVSMISAMTYFRANESRLRHLPLANVTSGTMRWASSVMSGIAESVGWKLAPGHQESDIQNASTQPSADNTSHASPGHLQDVESYLLAFRSPYIREPPLEYSWPPGHDGNGPVTSKEKKLIVWYNVPNFVTPMSDFEFFGHCPVSACSISRSYSRDAAKADAVLFHGAPGTGTPLLQRKKAGQVYVMFRMESPVHTGSAYHKTAWNSAFNWTWNFRLSSDIFEPVGILKRAASVPPLSFFQEQWRKKSKKVAWFSSNCGVQSRRDQYVKRMKNVISVDIFGRCGSKSCRSKGVGDRHCELILNDYFFYLSFENSMCQDYITEKFYKTFYEDVHVVPVVRGAANYARFFPKGTFVDAELFPSPEDLSHYLLKLMADEAKYTEMLWRKAHFVYHEHGIVDAWCQLCYKLNHMEKYAKTIPDLYSWQHSGKCRPPRPF